MIRASDAAYEALKSWIQSAEVAPGSLIDEDQAALRLSMSRTPVREALLRLQSEGFVEIGRRKGIRVLPLSAGDMRDTYQVITGIEVTAVSLLVRRQASPADLANLTATIAEMEHTLNEGQTDRWGAADERFHRELIRLSGNRKLYAVGCQMRDFAQRAHMVAVRLQDDAYRARSSANHGLLIAKILKGVGREAADHHLDQRQRGEDALVGAIEKFKLTNL